MRGGLGAVACRKGGDGVQRAVGGKGQIRGGAGRYFDNAEALVGVEHLAVHKVVVLEEKAVERVGVPVGIDKGYRVGGKVALGESMRKIGNREEG